MLKYQAAAPALSRVIVLVGELTYDAEAVTGGISSAWRGSAANGRSGAAFPAAFNEVEPIVNVA